MTANSYFLRVPDWQFLLQKPAHFLALGLGTGLSHQAPGTVGTMMGFPLAALLLCLPLYAQLAVLALLYGVGVWCCGVAGRALGVSDHGAIVWDEIVAMALLLVFTPPQIGWWCAAFALFRLFDIWKPFPIKQVDAKIKGGQGVMLDDVLAAVYAILVLKGLLWMLN